MSDAASDPTVTILSNGFIAVGWNELVLGDLDIRTRIYDTSGNAITAPFAIIQTVFNEGLPSFAALAEGLFVTAWQTEANEGGTDGSGSIQVEVNRLTEMMTGDGDDDTITGTALYSTLYGGLGNDSIEGNGGFDVIYGGGDNDVIYASADGGYVDAGTEDDIVGSVFAAAETLDGGTGNDWLANLGSGPVEVNLETGTSNNGASAYVGFEFFQGGNQTDSVSGTTGTNTMSGGAGSDTLRGEDGDDHLFGGLGDDEVYGGNGNDILVTDDGLTGIAGSDTLFGGADDDVLAAYLGTSTLYGGSGNDSYVVLDASYHTIEDESGTDDWLLLNQATTAVEAVVDLGSNEYYWNDQTPTIGTVTGIEHVAGTDLDDRLFGNGGANSLIGGNGDDVISSGGGADVILGDAGNDELRGGNGATVDGGTGNDFIRYEGGGGGTFIGGEDHDVFALYEGGCVRLQPADRGQQHRRSDVERV